MTEAWLESLSQLPEFDHAPKRVVSLVPSITESLFDLGFGDSVAGITEYCLHPQDKLAGIAQVGGPKNPDVEKIVSLEPELVFANQEENTPEKIRELADRGLNVWLSFPLTVEDALDVLRQLLAIYHTDKPALTITTLQMAVDYGRRAAESLPRVKYFCPIWQGREGGTDWWMTFNRNTYAHNLLEIFGGENVFGDRERRYPLAADLGMKDAGDAAQGRDRRYPRVTAEEILAAGPELILLPDEPFKFESGHKQRLVELLAETPAVKDGRIRFLDGSLITWHGTRLGKALQALPNFFQQ